MEVLKKQKTFFRTCMALGLAIIFLTCLQGTQALALQMDEQKVKAGLVYNLLKYTEWPTDASNIQSQRLEVCIFGDDSFQGSLDPMQGRTAQQYKIRITRTHQIASLSSCNLIFIPRSEAASLDSLLEAVRDKSILTVSDIPNFSHAGGMVELTMREQRIRLYIDRQKINSARLRMQDRLLRLAEGGTP